jgi:predicted Fe-Mo cluster-binding NifX family protein
MSGGFMRVALPVANRRIAPRLGSAETFYVIEVEGQKEIHRHEHMLSDMSPIEKIRFLKQQPIDVLICLGIEMGLYNYLAIFGVRIIPGVSGDVEQVIRLFLSGHLAPGPVPAIGMRIRQRGGHHGRRGRAFHWWVDNG